MNIIWEEQKKHVPCVQDPPDVELYTTSGYLTKGGMKLPILRCACGSTSLESFHLHLTCFISGTAANAVNFQAYLLDGVTRWNAAHALAALQSPEESVCNYDLHLQEKVNALGQAVRGVKVFQAYRPPAKYTGELFGVEYLYHQFGLQMITSGEDLEYSIVEGFEDTEDAPFDQLSALTVDCSMVENPSTVAPPLESESEDEEEDESGKKDEALDAHGIPGWDKVTNTQAKKIQGLYEALTEFDKNPLVFKPRVHQKPLHGRFAKGKSNHVATLVLMP